MAMACVTKSCSFLYFITSAVALDVFGCDVHVHIDVYLSFCNLLRFVKWETGIPIAILHFIALVMD